MRRGWPATSARSAATRPSSERAAAPAARARPVGLPAPGRGDGRGRALGGSADPRRAGGGSLVPSRRRSTIRRSIRAGGSRSSPSRENEHDPNAVGIWNEERTLQLGYVPREDAPRLAGDEQAVSIWRTEGGLARPDRARGRLDRAPAIDSAAVAYEFKLPDLGEGLTEGEVARWLVSEGDEVAEDQPLVEIQTDKTTVEIPSPAAGKVAQILVEEGKVVPVGTILVVIGEDGAQPSSPTPPPKKDTSQSLAPGRAPAGRVRATPLVRRLAQELNVDLEQLTGTGPQGRVTEADVRAAATSEGQAPGPVSEGRREPLRGVRRLIAEHMARAHREVPAVTWVEECDFSGVDLKLLVPTVLKAAAETLQGVPRAERAARGRRDRVPRPLRPRRRRPDRRRARRAGRPRLRLGLGRRARRGGQAPRGSRPRRRPQAGGAPRLDVHGHERRQARRAAPDADRQPPRGRDPQHRPDRRAPGRTQRRARGRARPATSRSRSTTAWSTEPAPPSSAWP